ncbi:pilus assembly protein [Achromobacter sp.]|uniref:TadE/TadG family type IV pilus assembly protein n=1 Tax=Achromobacter sp. TaxID=134375 RepID=UPI0028A7F35C|nr:pilus assembly protein [Achromobacter sp.]
MDAPHCAPMTALFFFPRRGHAPCRQHGAAAIEFAVAGAIVLLLGLLSVEAARWHTARQIAHLALTEAARAGATAHGDPVSIRAAFLQALLPLHADAQGPEGAMRRQALAMTEIAALTGSRPWRIEVLLPDEQSFREHSRPGLRVAVAPELRAIDNDYQDLQHGRQPPRAGGQDIFQANTLKLRLTYLHKPLLPPLRALLAVLGRGDDSYMGTARSRGLLPIMVELESEMHTHPVDWARRTPRADGVVHGECRRVRCN